MDVKYKIQFNGLSDIFKYFENDKCEKAWNEKNQDITDYFNYGFNENTFK
jgi:hypothetical protein